MDSQQVCCLAAATCQEQLACSHTSQGDHPAHAADLTACLPCRCAKQLPHTQQAKKGSHFFCPQHYCKVCTKSGDGKDMAKARPARLPLWASRPMPGSGDGSQPRLIPCSDPARSPPLQSNRQVCHPRLDAEAAAVCTLLQRLPCPLPPPGSHPHRATLQGVGLTSC